MDPELEDLQRRVEILESHLSTTEYGLGAVQMQLEMMTGTKRSG
jgi:hypothetical protein